MENDHQIIENFENFHNIKMVSREITSNNKYKEEINMDSTNNKTNAQALQVSLSSSKGVTNTSSPKMGSRRIFTPQFKLQVLESYRNDHDCKGNQRATARKYNIHRRQIQKWLQCEPSLRSSVANINQNSVKHQFHNVNMQQTQTKNVVIASQSSVNNLSYTSSELHSAHLCLDSIKASTSSHKTINVPSLSCVSTSSVQEIHDILDTGTIAKTNSSGTGDSSVTAAVPSPLRPSAIISANRNSNSSISPLLHHHHPHHYGITTYSNMSSTATVPILVHHLTSSHQTPYQYQNIPYSPPTLSHHQSEKQHSTSYFAPISLPTINVLSTAASASNSYTGGDNEQMDKLNLFPIGTKIYPKIVSDKSFLYNDNQFQVNYECRDATKVVNSSTTLESLSINPFNGDSSYSMAYPYGPMDLSLRHSRESKPELIANFKSSLQMPKIPIKQERNDNGLDVVDLTYRKRKVFNTSQSSNEYKNEFPEKQQKFSSPDAVQNKLETYNASEIYVTTNPANSNEDDDIEIEVGMEEKFPPISKPVKLFKPYLLDDCENNDDKCLSSNTNKLSRNEESKEIKQIEKKDDTTLNENTFPDILKENINICVESSNFLVESRSESPRSACSPATYIPTMSPTNFHYPKGSPASSGYESSTSTYSDTSLSSRSDSVTYGQTYRLNMQMQTIYHENTHVLHQSKQVQRWLEKDDSNSLETNSTIALLV